MCTCSSDALLRGEHQLFFGFQSAVFGVGGPQHGVPLFLDFSGFFSDSGAGLGQLMRTCYEGDVLRFLFLDEAGLRTRRPDLVATIETATETRLKEEFMDVQELKDKVAELEGEIATRTEERDGLQTQLDEAEKQKRIDDAQKAIAEIVDNDADLKEATRVRIKEQFKDAETEEGVAEAVEAEKKYIAELNDGGAIRELGRTETETPEKVRARIKENAKRRYLNDGKTEEEAERMADIYVNG